VHDVSAIAMSLRDLNVRISATRHLKEGAAEALIYLGIIAIFASVVVVGSMAFLLIWWGRVRLRWKPVERRKLGDNSFRSSSRQFFAFTDYNLEKGGWAREHKGRLAEQLEFALADVQSLGAKCIDILVESEKCSQSGKAIADNSDFPLLSSIEGRGESAR
jgi:hypothetical protein